MTNLIITKQIGRFPVVVQQEALDANGHKLASRVIQQHANHEMGGYSFTDTKQTVYTFVDKEDRDVARAWLKIHAMQTTGHSDRVF